MDILTQKIYVQYNYLNRYTDTPYYYNSVDKRYIYGIGSQMKKTSSYVLHKVDSTDTLDNLALKYYNNPTYWWLIAYFNDIQDAFIVLSDFYTELKIPNMTSITFEEI